MKDNTITDNLRNKISLDAAQQILINYYQYGWIESSIKRIKNNTCGKDSYNEIINLLEECTGIKFCLDDSFFLEVYKGGEKFFCEKMRPKEAEEFMLFFKKSWLEFKTNKSKNQKEKK